MKQLEKWRAEGDRLIVCMDANENIYSKSIGKKLTNSTGLRMKDAISEFTGRKLGATFFRGSTAIYAVWHTQDMIVVSRSVCHASGVRSGGPPSVCH